VEEKKQFRRGGNGAVMFDGVTDQGALGIELESQPLGIGV
jgi:hypothetical protein